MKRGENMNVTETAMRNKEVLLEMGFNERGAELLKYVPRFKYDNPKLLFEYAKVKGFSEEILVNNKSLERWGFRCG
jgi:hypothetical protein